MRTATARHLCTIVIALAAVPLVHAQAGTVRIATNWSVGDVRHVVSTSSTRMYVGDSLFMVADARGSFTM